MVRNSARLGDGVGALVVETAAATNNEGSLSGDEGSEADNERIYERKLHGEFAQVKVREGDESSRLWMVRTLTEKIKR